MNRPIAAALAAGLLLQGPVVFADATATASFSNLTIQLIDLDPGDGLVPVVSFQGLSAAEAIAAFTPGNPPAISANFGASSFGPVSATAPAWPYSGASASFAGDAYQGTGTATATAWAAGLTGPFGAVAQGIGEVLFGDDASPTSTGFVLSPHTALIISGFADLEGRATPGGDGQTTLSSMSMSIDAATSAGPAHSGALLRAVLDGASPSTSVTQAGELSVRFDNTDATPASGYYLGFLSASAASAVPEPPIATLLLAALAAMGRRPRSQCSKD